jgi:hypothetical protein
MVSRLLRLPAITFQLQHLERREFLGGDVREAGDQAQHREYPRLKVSVLKPEQSSADRS